MAGIKGQPGTKPSNVPAPIPGAAQTDAFDSAEVSMGKSAGDAFDSAQVGGSSAAPVDGGGSQPEGWGPWLTQKAADAAPTVAGGVMAIAGAPAGVPGIVGMGMAGAASGTAIKQAIEQQILGKTLMKQNGRVREVMTPDDMLAEIRDSSGQLGAELLAGEGTLKVLGTAGRLAAETRLGGMVADKIMTAAKPTIDYVSNFTDGLKKQIIQPVSDFLSENMTTLSPEASGDAVKQSLGTRITAKFNDFKQSYAQINSVAADTPMSDAARKGLTDKIRSDAVDSPYYKMAKGYTDQIDAAGNTQQVHKVISDVNAKISELSQYQTSGAIRDKIAVLQQISDRATDSMENFTYGMAQRISKGMASPQEMKAFEQMMVQQANPSVPAAEKNIAQYAKSVAKDYIDKREAINTDYAKFRSFLEDVGDQTRLKADGSGPMQFVRKLNEVPSEQLVERMFLPKNAAALRSMQEATPEVFQAVKQARVTDIYSKSLTDGVLDVKKLADNFAAIPPDSRRLFIPDAALQQMQNVSKSGMLKILEGRYQNWATKTVGEIADMTKLSMMATKQITKDAAKTVPARVITDKTIGTAVGAGQAYQGLADTYGGQ